MELIKKKDFMMSPYKSERDKVIKIHRWNVRVFFKLLDTLETFFTKDKCCRLADNYLVAMVFTYFLRGSLEADEYTRDNFFAALLLAYNMEEDEGEFLMLELEEWLECSIPDLKRLRSELFQRIEYRGAVSRFCCEIVMRHAKPEHKVWQRCRHVYHSGVVNVKSFFIGQFKEEDICGICEGKNDCENSYYERGKEEEIETEEEEKEST
ncbi:speedy protein A-like [Copidosoma floridanum]|nr:speedy protein A-like [Copidosoma floridanum]